MDDFEIIESGFNNADETINFGTRLIGYDSLYEISTTACLKNSGEISGVEAVRIKSLVRNGKYFLTVNKSIKVFKDSELSDILFNATFDSYIDTFCVSPDGKFLLLCLQKGTVHIFDLEEESENNCIFSKSPIKNELCDRSYISSYLENFTSKVISFIIVSSRGKIFRVIFSLNNMVDANETKFSMDINYEEIYDFESTIYTSCFSGLILCVITNEVNIFNVEDKINMSDVISDIKMVYDFGHKILAIDQKGRLFKICSLTLLVFYVDNVETLYEDMMVTNDNNGEKQIVAVTKKNELGESFLQFLASDFSVIFSLKLSHLVHIVDLENTNDNILIISEISNGGLVSELRIQCVYETQPELRLTRLIRKQQFDEAEQFAKMFNIDPTKVSEARAQLIVDKSVCSPEDVTNLLQILESIDDDYFKLKCCSEVECSNYEDVRRILNYGSTIVPKNHCENREAALVHQRVLMDTLFRFDTYMTIYTQYDLLTWSRFAGCDLVEELKSFLQNFQIEEAIVIYSRLDSHTAAELTEERIDEILQILNNLPFNIYQPFLLTFIPVTMSNNPSALPIFVEWLKLRIFHLEKRDVGNFPENCIRLAENILKLLNVGNDDVLLQRQCQLTKEVLDKVTTLMESLRNLQLLKNNFRINVPLWEYLQGPKKVIRTLLNIVMSPEEYDTFLKEFLYSYIVQNEFEPDEIFLSEIKNLMNYDEEYWVKIVESILKYISSVKVKLEAIKEILENAQVPWCDNIRAVGQSALQYSHPLVADIKNILENEPRLVVLRNPKYKIKEKQIATIYDLGFVVRRIIYINAPSMVEDVHQLCKSQTEKREVDLILAEHFIRNKKCEDAMSLLDNLGNREDVTLCAKSLVTCVETAINDKIPMSKYRDAYYQVLRPLFRRLLSNNLNKVENRDFEEDLIVLTGTYNINKNFGRNITIDDLKSPPRRKKLFNEMMEEISDNFIKGASTMEDIFTLCDKLALFFFLDKDSVLIEFCEAIAKYDTILKVAEHLYECESSSRNLALSAVLVLKYMGSYDTHLSNGSFSDNSYVDLPYVHSESNSLADSVNSSKNFLVGSKLAEKMIVKALLKAGKDELPNVLEVMNWVNSCYYLNRSQMNPVHAELFKDMFHSENILPSGSTFSAVGNIFNVFCRFIGKNCSPTTSYKYLTHFEAKGSTLTTEQLFQEISLLPGTIDSFCREGQHLMAYRLLITLENALRQVPDLDASVLKSLSAIITKKCLPQFLHVVVSRKQIDTLLLRNLLLDSGKDYFKYIQHYVKMYKRHPRKLHDIATVGIELLDLKGETVGKEVLVTAVTTCKWWNKLQPANNKVPYDLFFKLSDDNRLQLLLSLDLLDVGLVKEYCDDYRFNVQSYYMVYLKSILVNWKPDYECEKDLNSRGKLVVKNDEIHLYKKCVEVINIIIKKESVYSMLLNIWDQANFYHYEVFICIFKILEDGGKSEKLCGLTLPMLIFLKNYRRFRPPSQTEKEEWYGAFPDSQELDALSEFRLPFTKTLFTHDIWNIIRPEITLKSYKFWFQAISILQKNLKKDDICIYAVKEVVTSGLLGTDTQGSWSLYPKFENLFSEVDECAQNISDLERATSVVYHLMYHTPNGADKVNAARMSYSYAKKYFEKNLGSAEVEKAYIKVRTKYYYFSAMHILHTFRLVEDKYLQLLTQPKDLINLLYQDERIVQAEYINSNCPDINKAVDALGQLFDLSAHNIRYNLLNHYLSNSASDVDFDSTIVVMTVAQEEIKDVDNLKRAIYICSSGDKLFWQTYLFKIGLNEEDTQAEQKSFSFRAKALKCFCAISDIDYITQLTELSYTEFLNYIDKLSILSELECLGISLEVEALDQYNKKELLKQLSQVGKPLAVKVMASICITYFIKDIRYWEFIINKVILLGMYTELKTYVEFLKYQCYKPFYVNAWQVIINNAFNVPNTITKDELHEVYVKNFHMIQSCPVLYSLNFDNIVQKCIKEGQIKFAAVLLQYLPDGERKDQYVKVISPNRTLLLDLDNLSKCGIWGVRKIKSWLAEKDLVYD